MRKTIAVLVGLVFGYGFIYFQSFHPDWYIEFLAKQLGSTSLVQYLFSFQNETVDLSIVWLLVVLVSLIPTFLIAIFCHVLEFSLKAKKYIFYSSLISCIVLMLLMRYKLEGVVYEDYLRPFYSRIHEAINIKRLHMLMYVIFYFLIARFIAKKYPNKRLELLD